MKILGIDPAWAIEHNPSGIALVEGSCSTGWRCVRLACDKGVKTDLFLSGILDTIGSVDCLVLDIPLCSRDQVGRRDADNIVSHQFGKYKCSTHSPSQTACKTGSSLLKQAQDKGYKHNINIIETYPHPAILKLMRISERLPYKVNKTYKYWPDLSPGTRLERLKDKMNELKNVLAQTIILPDDFSFDDIQVKSHLKSFEDRLDALVCAWVGIQFMNNRESVASYGNGDDKIWIPI